MGESVIAITSRPPRDCSPGDVASFQALVLEGGEVNPNGLSERIARADRLAFAFLDHRLVGIGALKFPNTGYRYQKGTDPLRLRKIKVNQKGQTP